MPGLRSLAKGLIADEQISTFVELARLMDDRQIRDAETAYRIVIDSEESSLRPQALLEYAELVSPRDYDAAGEALLSAVNSEDEDVAPRAALVLGQMLEAQAPGLAADAFDFARKSGHPDVVAPAALHFGLVMSQIDEDEGEEGYRQAIATGDPAHAPHAALLLGENLLNRGSPGDALEPLEFAATAADAEVRGHAFFLLGTLKSHSDPNAAVADFARATESPDPDIAVNADATLGLLDLERGRTADGLSRLRALVERDVRHSCRRPACRSAARSTRSTRRSRTARSAAPSSPGTRSRLPKRRSCSGCGCMPSRARRRPEPSSRPERRPGMSAPRRRARSCSA